MTDYTDSIATKQRGNIINDISHLSAADKAIALRKHEFENQVSNQSEEHIDKQERVDLINETYSSGNFNAAKDFMQMEKDNGTFHEIENEINDEVLALGGGSLISDVAGGLKKTSIKQSVKKSLKKPKDEAEEEDEFSYIDEVGRVGADIIDGTFNNILETGDDLANWMGVSQAGLVWDQEDFFGTIRWVDDEEMRMLKESGKVTPRIVNIGDEPQTGGGQLISGMGQFVASMGIIFKATRTWKQGQVFVKNKNFVRNVLTNNPFRKGQQVSLGFGRTNLDEMKRIYGAAAFADFLYSPDHGNLSTLIKDLGVENEFLTYLDSSPETEDQYLKDIDAKMRGRFQNIAEGLVLGGSIDAVLGVVKYTKSIKNDLKEVFADREAIGEEFLYKFTNFGRTKNLDVAQGGGKLELEQAKSVDPKQPKMTSATETDTPISDLYDKYVVSEKDIQDLPSLSKNDIKNKKYNSAKNMEQIVYLADKARKEAYNKLKAINNIVEIKDRFKGINSLQTKVNSKGGDGKKISDYIGFIIDYERKDRGKVLKHMKDNFNIMDKELHKSTDVIHYQVLDDSGKFSFEIQVRNKDTAPIIDAEHMESFGKGKELRRTDNYSEADAAFDKRKTSKMEREIKNLATAETL